MEMERQSLVAGVKARQTADFVYFALRKLEIHSLMIQIRILSMILKIFPTTLHNPSTRCILMGYVGTMLIMYAQPEDIQELLNKLLQDLRSINEELAEYINSMSWNRPAFYNDDDDEYTI
ncbi:hypothetical protein Tco_1385466 [Tanacetum coccineum]